MNFRLELSTLFVQTKRVAEKSSRKDCSLLVPRMLAKRLGEEIGVV